MRGRGALWVIIHAAQIIAGTNVHELDAGQWQTAIFLSWVVAKTMVRGALPGLHLRPHLL